MFDNIITEYLTFVRKFTVQIAYDRKLIPGQPQIRKKKLRFKNQLLFNVSHFKIHINEKDFLQ